MRDGILVFSASLSAFSLNLCTVLERSRIQVFIKGVIPFIGVREGGCRKENLPYSFTCPEK